MSDLNWNDYFNNDRECGRGSMVEISRDDFNELKPFQNLKVVNTVMCYTLQTDFYDLDDNLKLTKIINLESEIIEYYQYL